MGKTNPRKSPASGAGKRRSIHKPRNAGIQKPKRTGRAKYQIGVYGGRRREQTWLKKLVGKKVTGSSHESDHQLAVEALTGGRLKRNDPTVKKQVEAFAPAIQVPKPLHRAHITTGSSSESESFRAQQHELAFNNDGYSSAVQMSFAEYAQMPDFQTSGQNSPDHAAMDHSFGAFNSVPSTNYLADGPNGPQVKTHQISTEESEEIRLGWNAARTGQWPSLDEVNQARAKAGIPQPPSSNQPNKGRKG